MSATDLFRGQALKRVSSPEQLDRVVRTTLPLQWLALITLLAVVAAAVAWSAIATVLTTVPSVGLYIPLGGLDPASTPVAGVVTSLPAFTVGTRVSAGQVLATVTAPVARGATGPPPIYNVLAPLDGVVVDADQLSGTYQNAGHTLGLIQPSGRPLVVYSYVSDLQAPVIHPGVAVQVTFGGVGGTYGYAKGVVSTVSQYPVDPATVEILTGNASLADVVKGFGPSKEIVIRMTPSSTPSGLAWSRGQGPPGKLPPGLPIDVQFVVGTHHPISNVI
jgi:hypothetical protein